MHHHAALATRIVSPNRLGPRSDREDYIARVGHALTAAGATTRLLNDHALELLWRASRGVVRTTATLLRTSLSIAHEREQTFVDDAVMTATIEDLALTQPSAAQPQPPRTPPPKPGHAHAENPGRCKCPRRSALRAHHSQMASGELAASHHTFLAHSRG